MTCNQELLLHELYEAKSQSIQHPSPARLPILREKHLLVGPILQTPLFDFSLKTPQVLGLRQQGRVLAQMLKERFGLQVRRLFQHDLGLGPYFFQRVRTRAPRMFGLKFGRWFARLQIFTRCGSAGIRLHCAFSYVSSYLMFAHESSVLLFGDHLQRPNSRPLGPNERCLIFPKPLTNQIIVTGKF